MSQGKGRLDGKVAIVTGAGGGFGEGIAKLFAEEGAKVGVLDLRADAAERVAAEIGEGALALAADVTSRAQMEAAVQKLVEHLARPASSSTTPAGPTATSRCWR